MTSELKGDESKEKRNQAEECWAKGYYSCFMRGETGTQLIVREW